MHNKIKLAAGTLLIAALSGAFYYTPYFAYRGLRAAAEADDSDKLARRVDFPAVQ